MSTVPGIWRAPQNVLMLMAEIIKFGERHVVHFFTNPVDCDWCGEETKGFVYEGMQSIVCSLCKQPLLIIEDKPTFIVTLEDDDEDDDVS